MEAESLPHTVGVANDYPRPASAYSDRTTVGIYSMTSYGLYTLYGSAS
jgi:hypothetical protein